MIGVLLLHVIRQKPSNRRYRRTTIKNPMMIIFSAGLGFIFITVYRSAINCSTLAYVMYDNDVIIGFFNRR